MPILGFETESSLDWKSTLLNPAEEPSMWRYLQSGLIVSVQGSSGVGSGVGSGAGSVAGSEAGSAAGSEAGSGAGSGSESVVFSLVSIRRFPSVEFEPVSSIVSLALIELVLSDGSF